MANYKNEFASNNVDLQSILDTVNNLPVQENIDVEISTQDDLIAQIYTALEGKTAGGGSEPMMFYSLTRYYANNVSIMTEDGTVLISGSTPFIGVLDINEYVGQTLIVQVYSGASVRIVYADGTIITPELTSTYASEPVDDAYAAFVVPDQPFMVSCSDR